MKRQDRTERCEKCGKPHPRCRGHNRAGNPCGGRPLADQAVCHLHGGRTPAALELARTRAAERAAELELRTRWLDGSEAPIADPLSELARVAGEAVAFKDYLRDQVADLNGLLTYWTERDFRGPEGEVIRTEAVENVRATVAAYERALDRCARILGNIVKLDLAGRLLALRTEQGRMIADAVREGLAEVDMSAELRRGVQAAIAERLAALDGPPRQLAAG